jgi:hypothetical protein
MTGCTQFLKMISCHKLQHFWRMCSKPTRGLACQLQCRLICHTYDKGRDTVHVWMTDWQFIKYECVTVSKFLSARTRYLTSSLRKLQTLNWNFSWLKRELCLWLWPMNGTWKILEIRGFYEIFLITHLDAITLPFGLSKDFIEWSSLWIARKFSHISN